MSESALKTFTIGGLGTQLIWPGSAWSFESGNSTPAFLSNAPGELKLTVSLVDQFRSVSSASLEHDEAEWNIYRSKDYFEIITRQAGTPVRLLRISHNWKEGVIELNRKIPDIAKAFPLASPLGELLYTHWLPWKDGLMVRGATLTHKKNAVVALGSQGSGKSTLSHLWADVFGVDSVLTDECTILRQHGAKIHAYGTPWCARGSFARPDSALLSAVVTVLKSGSHAYEPRSADELAAEITHNLPLPLADPSTTEKIMALSETIASRAPFANFSFDISPDAARFLASHAFPGT